MNKFFSQSQNFISALKTGIDPRTGIFSLNIPIVNINCNYGMGPEINLSLCSSSLQNNNSGFGMGFSLPLTTYDSKNKLLHLSSGEKYLINDTVANFEVKQKKLNNFIFERFDDFYKITYKSGVVEILEGPSSESDIKNTLKIESYDGHFVILKWAFFGFPHLLEIKDENNVLLSIDYENYNQPIISIYPLSLECYKIKLKIFNGHLQQLIKTTENYIWHFSYNEYGYIEKIIHPTGLVESIYYQRDLIRFPEDIYPALIAATRHTLSFQGEQPDIVTSYTYTNTNYLGFASGLNFKSDTDNLYSLLTNYTYGSTEIQRSDELIIETKRLYNNYHLLTNEITTYQSHNGSININRTDYDYYAVIGLPFDKQPPQFQFVNKKTITWENQHGQKRQDVYQSEFDEHGNPTLEIHPDGTRTIMQWYSAEESSDTNNNLLCPREKNGFVRFMKSKIVIPNQTDYQTPTTSTYYSYSYLENTEIIILHQEQYYADNRLLQKRIFEFCSQRNGIEYGRITASYNIFYQDGENSTHFDSKQSISTSIQNQQIVQKNQFQGHDGCQLATMKKLSMLSLCLLSEINRLGIQTNYTYDQIGRILSQTEAVGSAYERTIYWHYKITHLGPITYEKDSYGNQAKILFNSLGYPIKQYQFDNDGTQEWYEVKHQKYGPLGNLQATTEQDTQFSDRKQQCYTINTTYKRDSWGEITTTRLNNNFETHRIVDPILLTETHTQQGWLNGQHLQSGQWMTILNKKNQLPKLTLRIDSNSEIIASQQHFWDGSGRLRKQIDELGNPIEWTYDVYGRVLSQTLPDGTVIEQTYVPYLMGKEVSSIQVTDINGHCWVLGSQEFDSLGRLTLQESGKRVTTYQYDNASPSPSFITLPSGETVHYEYIPELNNAINKVNVCGVTQEFEYDLATAELLHSTEKDTKVSNQWSNSGTLKREIMILSGVTKQTEYQWTLQGKPVSYHDITGAKTDYQRDKYGRLSRIFDSALITDFTYDALGRLITQIVTDNSTHAFILTTFTYNEFNQEIRRSITDNQGSQLVIQSIWLKNGLLSSKHTTLDNKPVKNEKYRYDKRNRLIGYSFEGNEHPIDCYGQSVRQQFYDYDPLNNLIQVRTVLKNHEVDIAQYHYNNKDDPTQLTAISHSHRNYPANIPLEYDKCGRLILDNAGRTLHYDPLGRLIRVNGLENSKYGYNALNQIVSQTVKNNQNHQLYYRADELVNEITTEKNNKIRLIKAGHTCLAVGCNTELTLMANEYNDNLIWSLNTNNKLSQSHSRLPYGEDKTTEHFLGLNGERIDPITGVYHLGNGYRAYNPCLMRFHCPDSLSPFGKGGINPYAYCAGDPINRIDPSGHFSLKAMSGLAIGALGIIFSGVTFGASLAASGAIMASITLILSVASDATGIASMLTRKSDPQASSILGWASLALGIASIGTSVSSLKLNSNRLFSILTNKNSSPLSTKLTTFGGKMEGMVPMGKDFYFFEDIYHNEKRLNIVAHGIKQQNGTALLYRSAQNHMTPNELYEILSKRKDLSNYTNIRTIMCHSGNGGEQSFAKQLARLTNKPVKAYLGPVTGNFETEEVNKILLGATRRYGDEGLEYMVNLFSQKYEFQIRKTNPYSIFSSEYFSYKYDPIKFNP